MMLTIGTRGSLLALTQCQQLAGEIKKRTGIDYQLKIIQTEGDLNTKVPLWQMDGKDFFTKELDAAILGGEVDMTVHSYKDLGSERPDGIELAAISERKYPHDILLLRKEVLGDFLEKKTFVVGTSSPRRIFHCENTLNQFIPHGKNGPLAIETKILRGNVNTRLKKLVEGQYDAIILALAGLERLASDQKAMAEMGPMLEKVMPMVLPLSAFPSAASQGALAVEICNKNPHYSQIKEAIRSIHHQVTESEVALERKSFQKYGGGCHLAVGINAFSWQDGFLFVERGQSNDQQIEQKELIIAREAPRSANLFVGLPDEKLGKVAYKGHLIGDHCLKKLKIENGPSASGNIPYYTSTHTIPEIFPGQDQSCLAAGEKTHRELAKKGQWVALNADGRGDEHLNNLLGSELIQFFIKDKKIDVYSHAESFSSLGQITPRYSHQWENPNADIKKKLLETEFFFWTSYTQYKYYVENCPEIKNKSHACGIGKTWNQFKKSGISVTPFMSWMEFLNWNQA